MLTIISHFYNEEYLLPWWLKHHKKLASHGIMIDYNSTDRSVEIIKEICPTWTIVKSENELFSTLPVDQEVQKYEKQVEGYKIALNTTEFLVGDPRKLPQEGQHCFGVYRYMMIDNEPDNLVTYDEELTEKKNFGVPGHPVEGECNSRRYVHNFPEAGYSPGRHWTSIPVDGDCDMMIALYTYSPWTTEFKARKMQIRNKVNQEDIERGWGHHHVWPLEEYERQRENLLGLCRHIDVPKQEDLFNT